MTSETPVPKAQAQAKAWYQSRTIWLGGITLLLAVLAAPEVIAVIPLAWTPYLMALAAALGVILRFFTDQPVR